MQTTDALGHVLDLIESAPESAAALTLYALASTLEYPQSGCLFKLTKLMDLDTRDRALAYALMDLLATGEVGGEQWTRAKRRMDAAIRGDRPEA